MTTSVTIFMIIMISFTTLTYSALTPESPVDGHRFKHRTGGHGSSHSVCNIAALGLEHDVDKFDRCHRYDHLYCDILVPYHQQPFLHTSAMLEIGLGCGHPTPCPRSPAMWAQYLPTTTYYAIDWIPPEKPLTQDACISAMENMEPITQQKGIRQRIYFGDQENRPFLRETIKKIVAAATIANSSFAGTMTAASSTVTVGLFDIIVDDGGHTFRQQRTSFQELWPYVKEGGVYVVEDLQAESNGMPVVFAKWILLLSGGSQVSSDSKNFGGRSWNNYCLIELYIFGLL